MPRRWRRSQAGINRRAVSRRHVGGVEDILDAERHASEQSVLTCLIELVRPGQSRLLCEVAPCAHHRLAFGNPLEAAADDGLGRQLAAFEEANQAGGGKTMWFDFRHERTPGRQWLGI